ncbi:MAG: manganese efflux pump [Clostridia bacterium]|nr:manganese efflux pump [Clostridia bacterium]
MNFVFFLNSILLGIGLAMDAFSVSLVNGFNEPKMTIGRLSSIAGTFGCYQFFMPLLGWFCVHTITSKIQAVQPIIPYIALVLLLLIGGKMIVESFQRKEKPVYKTGFWVLMVQGIATSIDAISVGFTNAESTFFEALIEALIIGIVTYGICVLGLILGKRFSVILGKKAFLLGGIILISIGIEIFLCGILGG